MYSTVYYHFLMTWFYLSSPMLLVIALLVLSFISLIPKKRQEDKCCTLVMHHINLHAQLWSCKSNWCKIDWHTFLMDINFIRKNQTYWSLVNAFGFLVWWKNNQWSDFETFTDRDNGQTFYVSMWALVIDNR